MVEFITGREKEVLDKYQKALSLARQIIRNYQAEIKDSKWTGVDLAEKGFCQGEVYLKAIDLINDELE